MKHKFHVALKDRKFHPNRTRPARCPCGRPAITNNAANTAACAECLRIEASFAEGEHRRAVLRHKFGRGLAKYADRVFSLVLPRKSYRT